MIIEALSCFPYQIILQAFNNIPQCQDYFLKFTNTGHRSDFLKLLSCGYPRKVVPLNLLIFILKTKHSLYCLISTVGLHIFQVSNLSVYVLEFYSLS